MDNKHTRNEGEYATNEKMEYLYLSTSVSKGTKHIILLNE